MPVSNDIFDDVPLFAMLDEDERSVLAQNVVERRFGANTVIYRSGDAGERAFIVNSGRVEVAINDVQGARCVVEIVEQGGAFGLSSLLASANHLTSALAIEDTRVIEIDRDDLVVLLTKKPLAGLDLLTMAEKQLRTSHELLRVRVAQDPNAVIDRAETFGERVADAVARFGGSWTFLISFAVILMAYVTINSFLPKPWDVYPFILLNLFLSMLASVQAPIIMMSQNRQDAKDRVRSELDYRVNLKAELEVSQLMAQVERIERRLEQVAAQP